MLSRLDVMEICQQMDVDEDGAKTDAVLLAAIREHFRKLFSTAELDEELTYACDAIVAGNDGQMASLCFYLSGGDSAMASPDIEWIGTYRTLEHFREELRARGALASSQEAAAIPNARLLKLWRELHQA